MFVLGSGNTSSRAKNLNICKTMILINDPNYTRQKRFYFWFRVSKHEEISLFNTLRPEPNDQKKHLPLIRK